MRFRVKGVKLKVYLFSERTRALDTLASTNPKGKIPMSQLITAVIFGTLGLGLALTILIISKTIDIVGQKKSFGYKFERFTRLAALWLIVMPVLLAGTLLAMEVRQPTHYPNGTTVYYGQHPHLVRQFLIASILAWATAAFCLLLASMIVWYRHHHPGVRHDQLILKAPYAGS